MPFDWLVAVYLLAPIVLKILFRFSRKRLKGKAGLSGAMKNGICAS